MSRRRYRAPADDWITDYQLQRLNYLARQLRELFTEDFVVTRTRAWADNYIAILEREVELSGLGWTRAEPGQARLSVEEPSVRPTFITRVRRFFAPLFQR